MATLTFLGEFSFIPMLCVRYSLGIALDVLMRGKKINIFTENITQDIHSTASSMFSARCRTLYYFRKPQEFIAAQYIVPVIFQGNYTI
jgi:hypothetical protein